MKKKLIIFTLSIVVFSCGIGGYYLLSENDEPIKKDPNMSEKNKQEDVTESTDGKSLEKEKDNSLTNDNQTKKNESPKTGGKNNDQTTSGNNGKDTPKSGSQTIPKKDTVEKPSTEVPPTVVPPKEEPKKEYIGVPNPNDFYYSFHRGVIDYNVKDYPNQDIMKVCLNASIEISFKDTVDIINTNCMDVMDGVGTLLGEYLYINCKSGNCNRYKN